MSICLIILFLGLMSASITRAESSPENYYTLKTGESLDLGQGYFLEAKQIYVDDRKVWLVFSKNGEYIDDDILSPGQTWTSNDGDFSLKLSVAQIFQGAVSSIVQVIIISPYLPKTPVAAFSATPTLGKAPLGVSFTDNSINSPTSWKWTFGDGTTSTAQNPTHTYTKAGNMYTVTLTATNAAGSDTATETNYIAVTGDPSPKPVAAFSASPTSGKAPLNVQFTDKSTGKTTKWAWTFGDGGKSSAQNPTYKYTKTGKYTVSLTVKNAKGSNTKTIKSYITVKTAAVKPVAAFTASPRSGTIPLKVQFTDKSTGSPTSWKWDFGDGTTSTTHNPLHTYIKKGKLTVKLTVKNAAGSNTKTISNYITVK